MEPSTELANLEKENAERIDALIRKGVQLQPGTFELIQITTYLEFLIQRLEDPYTLERAKMAFAEKASEVITQLESAARRAKFMAPPNGKHP